MRDVTEFGKQNWQNANQLPAAVRLTVRDATSGRTLTISTTALVHVELPAACVSAKSKDDCGRPGGDSNQPNNDPHGQCGQTADLTLMTVPEPDRSPWPSAHDGFIIVAVLWILVALATLASIYSIYINNSALAVSLMDDGLQAEALVSASLELTAYRLTVPKDTLRPTRGQFGFRLGRANIVVTYSSETARIDLNAAPKILLAGFFAALGASNDDADRYADRIIGWRKPPKPRDQANEADLYRSVGLPYLPRGAPFAHASEMWLVQGLPPALIGRALPFVTVYSGRPDINVFDAAPELVAALPGMTPARLANFLNQRETASTDKDLSFPTARS